MQPIVAVGLRFQDFVNNLSPTCAQIPAREKHRSLLELEFVLRVSANPRRDDAIGSQWKRRIYPAPLWRLTARSGAEAPPTSVYRACSWPRLSELLVVRQASGCMKLLCLYFCVWIFYTMSAAVMPTQLDGGEYFHQVSIWCAHLSRLSSYLRERRSVLSACCWVCVCVFFFSFSLLPFLCYFFLIVRFLFSQCMLTAMETECSR